MTVRILNTADEFSTYEEALLGNSHATLWQSLAWKSYQESSGKEACIYTNDNASALVIKDRTALGFCTFDVSRGPVWKTSGAAQALMKEIVEDAKKERCIELTVSPIENLDLNDMGFTTSKRHVQPEATRILDISVSEQEILAKMHQKGRYNISLSERSGVKVRQGTIDDLDAFYELLRSTGSRDGFTIAHQSHYGRFLRNLKGSFMLLAEHEGRPIAGLLGGLYNKAGIYYYGASSYAHRHLMAPYALQWAALRHCKHAGCLTYDLLGVSPEPTKPNDPWLGISDFKRKFGGTLMHYPPEQILILHPIVKKLFAIKRQILG